MKKSYLTTVLTALLLATGLLSASAQEEQVYQIESREDFEACTLSCPRYDRDPAWEWYSGNGGYMRLWYYNSSAGSSAKHYVDDYVTTPSIHFEAGSLYEIRCIPLSYSDPSDIEFRIGSASESSPENFRVIKRFTDLPYRSTLQESDMKVIPFAVDADGDYRLAIRGDDDFLKVGQFRVYKLGASSVPAAVTDFTATPDASGALSASLTFTMPSATLTGQPLSGTLSYVIVRGETNVGEGSAAPGAAVSVTDSDAPAGNVTYTLTVSLGEDVCDPVTADTFIGLETPAAPGNAVFTSDGDTHTVTWTAPAGIHGIALDPSRLVYTVSRLIDGNATELGTVTGTNSYTDTYASDMPVLLSYRIVASNGTMTSAPAETAAVKVGSLSVPFANSFAGASLAPYWDVEQVSGAKGWEAVDTWYIGRTGTSAVMDPFDVDGGMAIFKGFDNNTQQQSRLVSAPILHAGATNPTVEFYFYHYSGNNHNDEGVKLQVSCDNGAWSDIPNALVLSKSGDKNGWHRYILNIANAVSADCSTFRIGFETVNKYGYNMAIDAVRVFNTADNDLQLTMTAPATVVAGNDIKLKVRLDNNGNSDIAAGSYTLAIDQQLADAVVLPATVDVPALSAAEFTVSVPLTAENVRKASAYTLTLTANHTGDSDPGNNSATVTVATVFSDDAPVEGLTLESNTDGTATLTWTSAGDPDYVPVSLTQDFENLEDGTTGNFDGFTGIDLDGRSGDTYYLVSGPDLNVFAPWSTVQVNGYKALGVTIPSAVQQDDWFITPLLTCDPKSTLEMSVKMGFRQYSYSTYTYEVLYSTDAEYDPADPAASFTNLVKSESTTSYGSDPFPADNNLHERTYTGIPAEARYIAIHFNNKQNFSAAMWMDDVVVTENNPSPLIGYNVYQQGVGRLNAELLPLDCLTFTVPQLVTPEGEQAPVFYVTAVYGAGESAPSPTAQPELPAGPSGLTASLLHDVFTGRNDIAARWNASAGAAQYALFLNGEETARTSDTEYIFENVASGSNVIGVRIVDGETLSLPTETTVTISDADYVALAFSVSSDNGYLPAPLSVSVLPEGYAEEYEAPVSDGEARIGFLPKGSYTASIEADGYNVWSTTMRLNTPVTVPVILNEITVSPSEPTVVSDDEGYLLSWNADGHEMWRVVDYTVTVDGTVIGNTTATSMRLEGLAEGRHTAGVSANYVSASTPEVTTVFNVVSGVDELYASTAAVIGLRGGIRISCDADVTAVVTDASGLCVATARVTDGTATVSCAPGIYLVTIGRRTVKVAVR